MTQYRVASHTPKYLGFLGDFLDLHKGDKERFSYCGGSGRWEAPEECLQVLCRFWWYESTRTAQPKPSKMDWGKESSQNDLTWLDTIWVYESPKITCRIHVERQGCFFFCRCRIKDFHGVLDDGHEAWLRDRISLTLAHTRRDRDRISKSQNESRTMYIPMVSAMIFYEAALKKNNHLWICDCDAELIKDNLKTTLTDSDSPLRPANLFFGVEVQGKTEMRAKELARIYFRSLEKILAIFQGPSWLEGGRWWFKIHGDFSRQLELAARFIFVPHVFFLSHAATLFDPPCVN